MYRPEKFIEDRPEVLIEAMQSIRLAAIVTPTSAGIEVTHAPMVVRADDGSGAFPAGLTLESHFARANAHWKAVTQGAPSVAIFQGPHAYVSPAWYPSKREHGKVVPTWTYIAVHAHGRLETVDDDGWLRRHLNDLTDANEAPRDEPWQVADAPERYIDTLARGIVGLRLTVERIEGAWKINQHKDEADLEGTREGLAGSGPMGEELAAALEPALAGTKQ